MSEMNKTTTKVSSVADYNDDMLYFLQEEIKYPNRFSRFKQNIQYHNSFCYMLHCHKTFSLTRTVSRSFCSQHGRTGQNDDHNGCAYSRGIDAFLTKQFDKAVECFSQVIELDPYNTQAYKYRSHLYGLKHEHNKAILDHTKLIEISTNDEPVVLQEENETFINYMNRGDAYCQLSMYTQAIRDYTDALSIKSNDSNLYINRGIAYQYQKQFDYAVNDFQRAIELNPTDIKPRCLLAQLYYQQSMMDKSAHEFAQVLEIDSRNSVAKTHLVAITESIQSED
jgi:tetratricopeptide (TPR) repeat protein